VLHDIEFNSCFKSLTGLREAETPFPWQQKLFKEFVQKQFRPTCNIPTGLGKTSVIAVWLLALAHRASPGEAYGFPRRLVYVVNRRTVVDQSTSEVEVMRKALINDPRLKYVAESLRKLCAVSTDDPLAVSTLRGQLADNAEWRYDPARPAVIVGTVDMIGSRLLFSGYGRGFKSRPLHAGFLGQDTLLVHDEAHLEPAFQTLLEAIKREQDECKEFMKLRIMAMTATMRAEDGNASPLFTDNDRKHPIVQGRIEAKKGIKFHPINDKKAIADSIGQCAMDYRSSEQAILIYSRTVKDVNNIIDRLKKEGMSGKTQMLTGTLRGLERDALAKKDPIFARFMPKPNASVTPMTGTVYLVCTSAGEVGVNISGDHLVCDLTPFDSIAQRFGRVNRFGVNRFGEKVDSKIDVIYVSGDPTIESESKPIDSERTENATESWSDNLNAEASKTESERKDIQKSPFDLACEKTFQLLKKLPKREDQRYDASPGALNNLPAEERLAAFTPEPDILPTSDILFDVWALTSVRQELPGRPPVADWLHGIAKGEPPETNIAWREEVALLTGSLLEKYNCEDLIEDYPVKPHELLRDLTDRAFKEFESIAARCPELNAWVIKSNGSITVIPLHQLVDESRQEKPVEYLSDCTVLLPPEAGGLDDKGFLDGSAAFDEIRCDRYDVSDRWNDQDDIPLRCRVWEDEEQPTGMRLIRTIDIRPDADDEGEEEGTYLRRYWCWYVRPRSADDDGSKTARHRQELKKHNQLAEAFALNIVAKLKLDEPEASAVMLAAGWHDLGKNRKVWQLSIGNLDYSQQVLAKSGEKMRPIDLGNFRHEFGSLLDVANLSEFKGLKPEVQDLVLHLIAAHHGRARPHFPSEEAFDHNYSENAAIEIAREAPRRFARLQRKYGRWGLAYLESLVRAADALASQPDDAQVPVKTAVIQEVA
jgi:CRISPR-associated endonuclease/helicase Cas3